MQVSHTREQEHLRADTRRQKTRAQNDKSLEKKKKRGRKYPILKYIIIITITFLFQLARVPSRSPVTRPEHGVWCDRDR